MVVVVEAAWLICVVVVLEPDEFTSTAVSATTLPFDSDRTITFSTAGTLALMLASNCQNMESVLTKYPSIIV
jgi:hypothetical protein